MSAAHAASQVERSRARLRRARSGPWASEAMRGLVTLRRLALAPPTMKLGPAQCAAARARAASCGAHRHVTRTRPAHETQVGADEASACAECDQPAGALAPRLGRLGVAKGQIRRQLGRRVGSERPFTRQASPTRAAAGPLGGQEQQVRRAVRRAGADHLGVPAAMNLSMKGSLKRTSSASMPTPVP